MRTFKKVLVFLAGLCFFLPTAPALASDNCVNLGPSMDLSGCDFAGLDLSGLNLAGSAFDQANLSNTNLRNTILDGVRSEGIIGIPSALPQGWIVLNGFLLGPTADLSVKNLSGMNLSNVDLSSANLYRAGLTDVKLENTDLGNADLESVSGNGITGTPLALPDQWNLVNGFLIGPKANLSSLEIRDVDFRELNIEGATLQGSLLIRANFAGMDMSAVRLDRASLRNANVAGTNFAENDFEGTAGSGLIGIPAALPPFWVMRGGYLFGEYANLSGLDLSNFDFTGLNLTRINFDASNLSNANLAGVNLTGAKLTRTNLTGANITDADLTDTKLDNVYGGNLVGTPIGLGENWTLFHGYLVGPKANLSNADLSNLDLRSLNLNEIVLIFANLSNANIAGMDLDQADLRGVNLSGANISGTSFSNANFTNIFAHKVIGVPDQLPNSWKLRNGYLLGPTTNLNNADLSGLDLKGVNLTEASLILTNFSNADLRGATLTGAYVRDADFTSANLLNVVSGNLTGTPIGIPSTFSLVDGTIKGIISLNPTPNITGLAKVGSTLTAVPGTWDEGVALSYQWLRNGVEIQDATTSKYILLPADYRKGISVKVTGTATGGATKSKISLDKPIALGAMKVVTPKITGIVAKGKTVTATVSAWGVGTKISYTWLLDGKAIKGATKKTYKILTSQVGKKLSVLVKQTGTGYTAASKASVPVKVK